MASADKRNASASSTDKGRPNKVAGDVDSLWSGMAGRLVPLRCSCVWPCSRDKEGQVKRKNEGRLERDDSEEMSNDRSLSSTKEKKESELSNLGVVADKLMSSVASFRVLLSSPMLGTLVKLQLDSRPAKCAIEISSSVSVSSYEGVSLTSISFSSSECTGKAHSLERMLASNAENIGESYQCSRETRLRRLWWRVVRFSTYQVVVNPRTP
jgi:hypothetical protein